MNILFFDTSQGVTTICASKNAEILPIFHDMQPTRQAELLVWQLSEYLQKHEIAWKDLLAIGCVNGIGGFTSVRIGVAAARGLALAIGVPSFGLEMLHIMAYYGFKHLNNNNLLCALPAGNAYVATQQFMQSNQNFSPMQISERAEFEIAPACCTTAKNARSGDLIFPIEETARLGLEMAQNLEITNMQPPAPIYARPADAKVGTPLLKTLG